MVFACVLLFQHISSLSRPQLHTMTGLLCGTLLEEASARFKAYEACLWELFHQEKGDQWCKANIKSGIISFQRQKACMRLHQSFYNWLVLLRCYSSGAIRQQKCIKIYQNWWNLCSINVVSQIQLSLLTQWYHHHGDIHCVKLSEIVSYLVCRSLSWSIVLLPWGQKPLIALKQLRGK